jgi:uncharacterized membrane protein
MLAGALIRHSFVARHKALVQQRRVPWEFAGVGVAAILGLAVWLAPAMPAPTATTAGAASSAPVSLAQVQAVVDQRCVLCHNAQVQNKGVALNNAALIQQHAQQMYQQVVVLKAMPFNNATGITDAERDLIRRWYEGGAPTK